MSQEMDGWNKQVKAVFLAHLAPATNFLMEAPSSGGNGRCWSRSIKKLIVTGDGWLEQASQGGLSHTLGTCI